MFSTWVGLGGISMPNLIQAGVRASRTILVYGNSVYQYTGYTAWIENLADASYPDERDVFGVACGDLMYAEVDAPNYMYIWDETSGQSFGDAYGPGAENQYAECMVEDPTTFDASGNPTHPDLMDFGKVAFSNCMAADPNTISNPDPNTGSDQNLFAFGSATPQPAHQISSFTMLGAINDSNDILATTFTPNRFCYLDPVLGCGYLFGVQWQAPN
jgi:hypothetical protein